MAEKDIIDAVKVGKSLAKGPPDKKRKKGISTMYFPVGRSISTIGGVLRMVNAGNVQKGVEALFNGNFGVARQRLGDVFEGGDVKGGAQVIATGIVLGRTLDHLHANPHVRMGKYGIKLV